ncbi:hypothetical protein [Burkholderia multivorans]|uniref:hypothetical protein n=1 Tax=Burkholderia multivorans TaxID=87883 RepID=UPI0015E43204|nr:hypothetical protein [Burkholderia multivorans]
MMALIGGLLYVFGPLFGALAGLALGFVCTVVVCALILVGAVLYILIRYPKRRAPMRP